MDAKDAVVTDVTAGQGQPYREPGFWGMLAYSFGSFPVGMLLLAISVWLMRLYCPTPDEIAQGRQLLVDPAAFGLISAIVMFFGALADPLVGFYSDRMRGTKGRRMPFIKIGLPFLLAGFLFVWFSPFASMDDTAMGWLSAVWLFINMLALQVSFTVVVNPYLALMPEVWESDRGRVRVSIWMSIFNALAQIFVFIVFGPMISNYMDGGTFLGIAVTDGFKLAATIGTLLTFLTFLPVLAVIRERPHSVAKEVPWGLFKACWETLKNPAFVPYIVAGSMMYAGMFLVQAALPYVVATQVVGETSSIGPVAWLLSQGSDTVSGIMLLGLVVFSIAFYPFVELASRRIKRKTLFFFTLGTFLVVIPMVTLSGMLGVPAWMQLAVCCLLIAPGLAVGLVVPRAILADIMDLDTERTGYRREAMYNGMEGLLQKIAGGLALMIQGFLFSQFGYSTAQPWGIVLTGAVAAFMAMIGIVSFYFYPIRK